MEKNDISKITDALKQGFLIIYPTETLYGIGADIYDQEAVKNVFRVKKRSYSKPLSVAVYGKKDIEKLSYFDESTEKLIDTFLPGPLTLVLNKKKVCPNLITGGLDKVGIRVPDNILTLKILKRFGPLTCTSANIHGMKTPSKIKDIKKTLNSKKIKFYIDEGSLPGKASTVVDITSKKVKILREGVISKKDILDVIKS